METILIKPKDEAEERFIIDLMKRMDIEVELPGDVQAVTGEKDFVSDFERNVEEVKMRLPGMKNLQRTRELLYEFMRAGYARLQKI